MLIEHSGKMARLLQMNKEAAAAYGCPREGHYAAGRVEHTVCTLHSDATRCDTKIDLPMLHSVLVFKCRALTHDKLCIVFLTHLGA